MAEKSSFPLTGEFQEFLACFSDSSPVNLLQITIFDHFLIVVIYFQTCIGNDININEYCK